MTDLELFRDYYNNFLTVERFAEHHGITVEEANRAIAVGRAEHNALADQLKAVETFSVDELAHELKDDNR